MIDSVMGYIDPNVIPIPVVLYVIGYILKSLIPNLKNNYIPVILLVLGVLLCSLVMKTFNIDTLIQGFLVTASTVFTNQLFKQFTEIPNNKSDNNRTA